MSATEAVVTKLPKCDLADAEHPDDERDALYDGRTLMGPWAYMCADCMRKLGRGIGAGVGQRLVVCRGSAS